MMNPSLPALELQQVSKIFTSKPSQAETAQSALREITFTVQSGEFVCVVGPSGCGKSTLFNLIAQLDRPTSGHITTQGKLGFMFQESALFPWLTAAQNVGFGLRIQRTDQAAIDQRVQQCLVDVQLEQWANHYPHELSGGMRQRVALARTLILEPDIVLMDEPFSALDAQTRENLHEHLQTLWQRTKKTVLFVTHDIREACFLADRIIVLTPRPGRILDILENMLPRPRDYFDSQLDELAKHIRQMLDESTTQIATQVTNPVINATADDQ